MIKKTREKISDGVNLNIINTDKFKTELISIYFILPLEKDYATLNALLPLVLRRGTKKFKTSLEIQKRLEELYGCHLNIDVNKKGEKHAIRLTIEGPSQKYVFSKDIFKDKLEVLKEIIFNPLTEDGYFISKYLEQEKNNLKDRISSRINDKKQYAVDRCIEEMCKDEPYSTFKYGYIDDLKNIDEKKLYKHYLDVIKKAQVEISIVSDIDKETISQNINDFFVFDDREVLNLKREEVLKENVKENIVKENMNINQGKLTLGFRTNIPYEDELYVAFLVGNNILGGGPESKLFINVREKESLAYYVYSRSYKYKSLLLIASGIEFDKYEKSLDIIKKQVESIKQGEFEEKNISQAKKALITSIKSIRDNSYSLSEFYLSRILTNDDKDIDELIESINKVTKEEIEKAMNKIELDTVYFLKNKS